MSRQYASLLREYITGLVEEKHTLGYSFSYGELALRQFDRFCVEKFPRETTITKEMGLDWATMRSTESGSSPAKRMAPVRELAKYMIRRGLTAYVIPADFVKQSSARYAPHIFTDNELRRIFDAADRLQPPKKQDALQAYVTPVLFRLLYCCGLRPQEGRLMKRCDIDLESGILKIPESKKHKDRFVMLSDSMLALCRRYYKIIQPLTPGNEYFFPSGRHLPVHCSNWLVDAFWDCWELAELGDYTGNRPRPYDFRHTFATKRLYLWLKEGRNLESCLPYLSAYMGHAHLSQTAYYIHLVPEFFPQMAQLDLSRFSDLLPEVE